ncbi:MAG: hypothetical protein J6334_03865, partial [Kiritimatiellae bacterium]|nr:hypothetical protein [Kiritimatiellia bacterium]
LTVKENFRHGHWGGTPGIPSTHLLEIYGELNAPDIIAYDTYDCPRGEIILKEGGVFRTKGIWANRQAANSSSTYSHPYGNGTLPGEGRHWFLMEGGLLELGSSGFCGQRVPGVTKYDFQNGTIVNVNGAWGGSAGFPLFFGYEKLGGKVIFDLGEYYINWQQGLSGASDVTLRGSVNFQGRRIEDRMQGVLLGKFTVENTGGNDLSVVSAFGGGLTLADGVTVQVAKYSDEHYPFAIAGNVVDQVATTEYSYPFISSDYFTMVHKNYSSNPYGSYNGFSGRGEFYVPEEKAGVWTFAGNFDDILRFDVDGTQIVKNAAWNSVGIGSVELSAGWHTFTICEYDGSGGYGPSVSGWGDGKVLGFVVGSSTAESADAYTKFAPGASLGDDLTLQIRPRINVCVWSWQNGNGNWATTENWTHIKCIDTVAPMHKNSGASDASTWSAYCSGKANRFQGWFKVQHGDEGEWTFKMGYDDNKSLTIDGVELINHTTWNTVPSATKTLDPGWHRWEVRVSDGSGGWGPNGINGGNTLSYIAPGAEEKQFNEQNLTLAATLGDIAVLEPTGIYKELELGEDAKLVSTGTMPMPIYGTLKGTGILSGAFVFAGDQSAWAVTGTGTSRELAKATFENPTRETFTGLSRVTATFDVKPTCANYYLTDTPVTGLTGEDVAGVTVTVKGGNADYSEKFALMVKEGYLVLKNASAEGTLMLLK